MEHLFSPLGIHVDNVVFQNAEEQIAWSMTPRHTRGWVMDPQGNNTASWGLTLTPSDMAKIGQLYLNGGVWNGRRLLPAGWIEESTREQSRWNSRSYGFLWWIQDTTNPIYAAFGDGGNAIYVNTKKKLVISITSLFTPDARFIWDFIEEHIEPLIEG